MQSVAQSDWSHRIEVGEEETAVGAVVRAVTVAEACAPEDLAPVHRTVDADALNALFEHGSTGRSAEFTIEFTYEGYLVQVSRSAVRLKDDTAPVA